MPITIVAIQYYKVIYTLSILARLLLGAPLYCLGLPKADLVYENQTLVSKAGSVDWLFQ